LMIGSQTCTPSSNLGSGPPLPSAYFEADTLGRGTHVGTAASSLTSASASTRASPAALWMWWLEMGSAVAGTARPFSHDRLPLRRRYHSKLGQYLRMQSLQ